VSTAIATLSAQEEIEKIRGLPFDTVLGIDAAWVAANPPAGFVYLKNPVCTVTTDDIYGNGNIRRLSVVVRWRSTTGPVLQTTVVTLMSRNGINKQ